MPILYNSNLAGMLLGCVFKNPQLLFMPQYPLEKKDFSPVPFHKSMFICALKLAKEGVQEITEIEVDNLIKNYPKQQEILEDNNYFDFMITVKDLCTQHNFDYYYNIIRKFSLLRDLKEQGFNIEQFYDEDNENEEEENSRLESLTIQDILSKVELETIALRKKFDVNYVRDEIIVGEDIDNLLKEFEDIPSFGAMLTSPFLSEIIHGFSRGNLILRSSPSGTNKTRMAVADMCGLCVDKYYDTNAQDFVDNPNYQGPGLFIHTELDTRREMQPMFLSCISGVESNKITMGKLDDEEKIRVKEAANILYNNNLRLSDMPDFTSASLERKIKESVENDGAIFVCFDYMMLNSAFSMEYKERTGVQAREDMALRDLATDLKFYAEKYQVGLLTMSQTNGNEKLSDFPDDSCIAGSKAMRNKVDAGFVMLPAKERPKEIKLIQPFFDNNDLPGGRPNRITYVYKARFGEYQERKLKIFHKFNPGIMRNTDYFVCDNFNKFVNIPLPSFT